MPREETPYAFEYIFQIINFSLICKAADTLICLSQDMLDRDLVGTQQI